MGAGGLYTVIKEGDFSTLEEVKNRLEAKNNKAKEDVKEGCFSKSTAISKAKTKR